MDTWKFYAITHREHVICNPLSEAKLAHLIQLLRLPPQAPVVDIACGKGEFLIRLAEAYDVHGLGVDISPYFIAEAEARRQTRAPDAHITFTQMNGADFKPEAPHRLALASCIGASWIFGGHAQTLEALLGMVQPGGWVIVGEPYWRQTPADEYLEAIGCARDDFGTHASNVAAGERRGAALVYTLVSAQDDWDQYEGLQWFATAEYTRTHPDDPDLAAVTERVRQAQAAYLRWGRDTLGWAIYVFKSRSAAEAHDRPANGQEQH